MKLQVKRLIAQIVFLISANLGAIGIKTGFCYPFFYCHACPAADAGCPLRALELSVYRVAEKLNVSSIKTFFTSFYEKVNWNFFFYPLLILGFAGVLSGRAVCGWVCPIGFLQRATGRVAKRINKYSILKKLGSHKIEPYLRYVKYINLLVLVIIIPFFIGFMLTDICPVGFLTGTIPIFILNQGKFIPSFFFYAALIVFILFIILIFTVERGWCRYFCPVGAILAPFNKISYIYVGVDSEACNQCHLCSNVCPMGIDIPNMHRDPECIYCGKCIENCPRLLINYKRK